MPKKKSKKRTKAPYGYRPTGEPKGSGWLGPIKIKKGPNKGKVITELSIGVNINGKEMTIPTLVPTLNATDIEWLANGNPPTKEIVRKAVEWALMRMRQGKSPYKD